MRETQTTTVLQQWRGVDQRTQPTLVQDGFFVMARGVYFGLGENAERVPGKKLAGLMSAGVFSITAFDKVAIVQLYNSVIMIPISELMAFDILPPVSLGIPRITEDGDTRITEDGDTRTAII